LNRTLNDMKLLRMWVSLFICGEAVMLLLSYFNLDAQDELYIFVGVISSLVISSLLLFWILYVELHDWNH
jgi:hypothetical protein